MPPTNGNASTGIASAPEEAGGLPRHASGRPWHWRDAFASLRHRNFRLFFAGQLISLVGTWTQNTAQGWLVYQLTGSKMWLGAVAAAASAPIMLFSVWGGSAADRLPKRIIMLWTQTGMMALAFVYAALVWRGQIRPWQILVLAALGGVAMAFDLPARQSFMMEMTSREDLINAVSLNSSIVNGARVLGPSLAGLLMVHTGMVNCFLVNGLSYLAVIAGLQMMRLPPHVRPARPGSKWSHAMEGFGYVWERRQMRLLLMLFAVVGVFGWSYSVLMPAFARDALKVGEGQYSLLLSANGIGALIGALTVATLANRVDRRRLVFGGLGVFSTMLLLLAVARPYAMALICLGVAGWGMLLFFSTTNSLFQTGSSDAMRGRVMGVWALVFGGMTPIGGLEAGALSNYAGVRWAVAVGGCVCGLAALIVWSISRQAPDRSKQGGQ